MNRPTVQQQQLARRMLSLHADGEADAGPGAVVAVYQKLHEHLDPLLGVAGVQALLVRAAKLTAGAPGSIPVSAFENLEKLRAHCEAPRVGDLPGEPQVKDGDAKRDDGGDGAAALFATFLKLLTTFIGERLTMQALSRAWPTLETQHLDAKAQEKP